MTVLEILQKRIEINDKIFEVRERISGKGFEIVRVNAYSSSQALICDADMRHLLGKTPYFESKAHAIEFMLKYAVLLH